MPSLRPHCTCIPADIDLNGFCACDRKVIENILPTFYLIERLSATDVTNGLYWLEGAMWVRKVIFDSLFLHREVSQDMNQFKI